ncbi:PLP-dependent aminotransferase family protein [Comamonas sp. B-9]|uniref:aminotransferase-like domain-containing protein n=1 Tax=Comamonas sp. B-9 TaxID=1055192 RepID=UPI000395D995|nr:PLP-dependent aminotransferase family protein [Comamonas sp. B-9]
MLTRDTTHTLTEQLAARFAERIRSRLLPAGARLPSVRACAAQQSVSPYTVVAAYDLLQAQGLVEARRQRGFYVRDYVAKAVVTAPPAAPAAKDKTLKDAVSLSLPAASARINATSLIRGMMHKATHPQPGAGMFPPEWLQNQFLQSALRKVVGSDALHAMHWSYGAPMGDELLRALLADRLKELGLPVGVEQVMTTMGATQGLDIVSRTLLKAGDAVMVEEPGWSVEFARLAALGMQVLPVPRGPDGPDLAVMRHYCETHAPKLYVSVSVLHNPTSYSLHPAAAHQVLQLAQAFNFYIVEDDTYSHIAPEHATRLSVLDGLKRSIYVSGFAKILAPNWRVGYMVAPPDLVDRMLDTKLLSTLTSPAMMERAMALCMENGQLRRHIERMRSHLVQARKHSVPLALESGCRFVTEPAGMFGWVDTGMDTEVLAQRMLDENYLIAPGSLFHASRQPSTLMRINYACTQDPSFWRVYQRVRAEFTQAEPMPR